MKCEHLDDILAAEKVIIMRELAKNVENKKTITDFVLAHGEEMRANYCGNVCPDRSSCELAKKYLGGEQYE